jgi:two-component system, NtrC family, sensor kinase
MSHRIGHVDSIKKRLTRMQVLLAFLVLSLSSLALMANDLFIMKRSVERHLETTASILGNNLLPTLAFMDRAEAQKILTSLAGDSSIDTAAVLDSTGTLFAAYGNGKVSPITDASQLQKDEPFQMTEGHIRYSISLKSGGDSQGTLVLYEDLWAASERYKSYMLTVMLVFIAGLVLSVALAQILQRSLSGPITKLAATVKNISSSNDYSLRMSNGEAQSQIVEIQLLSSEFNRMLDHIQSRDREIQTANGELERKVEERTAELKDVQKQALQNAHAAGMAEVATGVLHNIGNVINSVNTSAGEIARTVNDSKVQGLIKANFLLRENMDRLTDFLTNDPKARPLMEYYLAVGDQLEREMNILREEVRGLSSKVTLVKDVVQMQQQYAKKEFLSEEVNLPDLTEEVLELQRSSLTREGVQLIKNYSDVPNIKVQKVKFAQLLINLVKNGKEAMVNLPPERRILTLEIGQDAELGVYLRVIDRGEGISAENRAKIFSHGFTTKKAGHGFGLHFCANAMTEMGGRLLVDSMGEGKGATFTLSFGVNKKSAQQSAA